MNWPAQGEDWTMPGTRRMQTRKVLSKLNLLATKNIQREGQAAEASFYSQINGSYSSPYGLIEQILTATKVMRIRQQKETKINTGNPHWLQQEKRTEADI